jgi:hypothetical protein
VCFHTDARDLQQQMSTARCLVLTLAAIVSWQIPEIDRVLRTWNPHEEDLDPSLLTPISPIGWDHVLLYGEVPAGSHPRAPAAHWEPRPRPRTVVTPQPHHTSRLMPSRTFSYASARSPSDHMNVYHIRSQYSTSTMGVASGDQSLPLVSQWRPRQSFCAFFELSDARCNTLPQTGAKNRFWPARRRGALARCFVASALNVSPIVTEHLYSVAS